MIFALIVTAVFCALCRRLGFLSLSGALAATLLGTVILSWGGWSWILPLLAFFISSSLLSRARKRWKGDLEEAKGYQRDAVQVLANGGPAGIVVLIQHFTGGDLYLVYLGTLAAVNADTWSTEIGVMLGRRPRNIVSFKLVPTGTSGGVTLYGLWGAVLGAVLIAVVGKLAMERQTVTLASPSFLVSPASLLVITMAGFFGSVFDSLLGATVQEKRRCRSCGRFTERLEHCKQSTHRIRGIPGLNNDGVNFLCGAMGGLILLL